MRFHATLGQRVLQYFANSKALSDARRMELYPPFFLMRIKVLEISPNWRTIRMLLPLNTISRNPGGVMFGGYQAALADPIAALACARVFPGYSHWTRAMTIDFRLGGSTDLELRFQIEVCKLVGASDAFIRRPFLYLGLWYGVGGGLVAVFLVQLIGFLLKEPVSRVAGLYGSDYRLLSLGPTDAGWLLLAGAALGWLGSWIAASRHLRDMDPEF